MPSFSDKTNLAFHIGDYLSTCIFLKEAYGLLMESDIKIMPSSYTLSKGLIVLEELIELPEIELTDYLSDVISQGKTALLGHSDSSPQKKY